MNALVVLIISFIVALTCIRALMDRYDYRLAGRISMATMLIFTALGHVLFTEHMAAMIPDVFPAKFALVILTGILELTFATTLLVRRLSVATGWCLVLFFIAVLPANIKAALEGFNYQTGLMDGPGPAYLWFRIPLQVLFITWIYLSAIRKPLMDWRRLENLRQ